MAVGVGVSVGPVGVEVLVGFGVGVVSVDPESPFSTRGRKIEIASCTEAVPDPTMKNIPNNRTTTPPINSILDDFFISIPFGNK